MGLDEIVGKGGERAQQKGRERAARARLQCRPAREEYRHRCLGLIARCTSPRGSLPARAAKTRRRDGWARKSSLMLRNIKTLDRMTADMTADLLASGEAASRGTAPGRLTIDLGALADNWRALAKLAAPGRTAAVVKADAYGIGLENAGPVLWSAGARVFFVAHSTEGIAARHILPKEAAIVVLNGLEGGADPADYAEHGLQPAIGSEEELERWASAASRFGRAMPCALHLDTGMRRLGFESLAALTSAMDRYGAGSGADR